MKRANILKILMVSQRDSCYRAHDEMGGTMLVPTLGGDKGYPKSSGSSRKTSLQ